jgi:hypothetical protein
MDKQRTHIRYLSSHSLPSTFLSFAFTARVYVLICIYSCAATSTYIYPGARYGATTWTDTEGTLWMFSGVGAEDTKCMSLPLFLYSSQLFKYDFTTSKWTLVSFLSSSLSLSLSLPLSPSRFLFPSPPRFLFLSPPSPLLLF